MGQERQGRGFRIKNHYLCFLAAFMFCRCIPSQELSRLIYQARSWNHEKRIQALEALLSMEGDEGRKAFEVVFRYFSREIDLRFREASHSKAFRAARKSLEKELVAGRSYALSWILDPVRFSKGKGIREMRKRVNEVRKLWERPEDYMFRKVPALRKLLDAASDVSKYARKIHAGKYADLDKHLVAMIRKSTGTGKMGISKSQYKWNREVRSWNEKDAPISATKEEFRVMRLINDYRIMMGFKALEMDERLIRCARAHSQEMEDLGYFSHTSPVLGHESFVQRARLQGYSPAICENIAMVRSPEDAFGGWFLSAGHHRNMLAKAATAMGVGRSRKGKESRFFWTMNFGKGDSLRNRKLKDPALIYLARRRKAKDAKDHLKLAKWCMRVGLINEMCRECREALKLDPSLKEARKLLSKRLKLMEKFRKKKR